MRISSLYLAAKCPRLRRLRRLIPEERDNMAAADTGTAAGRVVELWHATGRSLPLRECIATARSELPGDADWSLVEAYTTGYVADPRNSEGVVAEYQELEMRCVVDGVELVGHCDQIRRGDDGRLHVWDLKCGVAEGQEMVYSYAWQLAGYAVAASETLGEDVHVGGIIRMRGYHHARRKKQPDPAEARVFFHADWELPVARSMLRDAVASTKAALALPGAHCRWCPAGGPNLCAALLQEVSE